MKLRTTVVLRDDKGQAVVFGPDSDVPAWAVERITNPKAWADESESVNEFPDFEGFHKKIKDAVGGSSDGMQEPPRAGKGSSLEAWQAYAKSKGLTDADLEGATRDDLIATVGSRED